MRTIVYIVGFLAIGGLSAPAQESDRGGRRDRGRGMNVTRLVGPMLATAADQNGNKEVSGEEWQSFLAALKPDGDGGIAVDLLKRTVFVGLLDRDHNQTLEKGDIEGIFAALDRDGDKILHGEELGMRRRGPGSREGQGDRPSRRFRGLDRNLSTLSQVARAADTDGNREVTSEEWTDFVASLKVDEKGALTEAQLTLLMNGAERSEGGRRSRGFGRLLDFAFEGRESAAAVTVEGLQKIFAEMDKDGDKVLQENEMKRPRRRGPVI